MAGVTVRRAGADDARAIAAIHVRAWRVAYRGLVPDAVLSGLSVKRRERAWRELLDDEADRSFTLVAELAGRVAGFCSVATPSRDEDAGERTAEVAAVYVDPDRWGRGVGGALLATAMKDLARGGWDEATLWVFARNQRAR